MCPGGLPPAGISHNLLSEVKPQQFTIRFANRCQTGFTNDMAGNRQVLQRPWLNLYRAAAAQSGRRYSR
jgi:hypothetical protein